MDRACSRVAWEEGAWTGLVRGWPGRRGRGQGLSAGGLGGGGVDRACPRVAWERGRGQACPRVAWEEGAWTGLVRGWPGRRGCGQGLSAGGLGGGGVDRACPRVGWGEGAWTGLVRGWAGGRGRGQGLSTGGLRGQGLSTGGLGGGGRGQGLSTGGLGGGGVDRACPRVAWEEGAWTGLVRGWPGRRGRGQGLSAGGLGEGAWTGLVRGWPGRRGRGQALSAGGLGGGGVDRACPRVGWGEGAWTGLVRALCGGQVLEFECVGKGAVLVRAERLRCDNIVDRPLNSLTAHVRFSYRILARLERCCVFPQERPLATSCAGRSPGNARGLQVNGKS